jgi:hypothetical protein
MSKCLIRLTCSQAFRMYVIMTVLKQRVTTCLWSIGRLHFRISFTACSFVGGENNEIYVLKLPITLSSIAGEVSLSCVYVAAVKL